MLDLLLLIGTRITRKGVSKTHSFVKTSFVLCKHRSNGALRALLIDVEKPLVQSETTQRSGVKESKEAIMTYSKHSIKLKNHLTHAIFDMRPQD